MAEKSSFFDSIGDDRLYNSADFAEFFNSLLTNGVFPNPSTNLQIISNDDMTATVKVGKAWIKGYVYINDSDLILPIEVADGVLNRIDRIVVQFNTVGRAINAVVKKGTFASSPVAPALVRDADFYELGIADIYIVNGATNIVQGDITDLRMNTTYCGWVDSLIQADTTAIFDQYQAWFTTQSDNYDVQMTANEAQFQSDFDAWFATVQNTLDGDTAGNLLNLINANSAEIGDLSLITETDLVSAIQADRSSLAESTTFDKIIKTQAQFETLIASSTWLDAVSVCFVGDGGTLKFTRSDGLGVKIPQTVKQIQGVNNAIIEVTNFAYNSITSKGGLWYATLPTTVDYSINDLTVNCNSTTEYGYGFYGCTQLTNCMGNAPDSGYGFYGCTQLTNCTGTSTGSGVGHGFFECTQLTNCMGIGTSTGSDSCDGFYGCTQLTNCMGTSSSVSGRGRGIHYCTQLTNCMGIGTGGIDGWGFYDCHYMSNCKAGDTASTTALLGGTNTQVDNITVV